MSIVEQHDYIECNAELPTIVKKLRNSSSECIFQQALYFWNDKFLKCVNSPSMPMLICLFCRYHIFS